MAGHCIRHSELLASSLVLWELTGPRLALSLSFRLISILMLFTNIKAWGPQVNGNLCMVEHSKADQDKATCLCY